MDEIEVIKMETLILDVQRCSLHDGPGIRTTVFLKGCPLNCRWCHNPESKSFYKELSFNGSLCLNCGECEKVCSQKIHSFNSKSHIVDFSRCTFCGKCVNTCLQKSLSIIGKAISPQQVFDIIIKDKVFYNSSGGGVTISGGEALSHGDFCLELLKLCKQEGLHTCIETSGFSSIKVLPKLLPLIDLFLYDYKLSNENDAKPYIGGSLENIKKNFDFIYKQGKEIILRCPIIPGINDNEEHFSSICEIIKNYPNISQVELLPYHNFGISKVKNLGKEAFIFITPTEETKKAWMDYFKCKGVDNLKIKLSS